MFSFGHKESPPLQLYGKLPLARDYLRVGCGDPAPRALREWLDHGFSVALGAASAPSFAQPMRFLVAAGDTSLVGCAGPSSDEGGLRPFPIVALVERKKRAVQADLAAGLAGLVPWWRALEAELDALGGFADGQALLEALRGRKVEPVGPVESTGVDFEEWVGALWPAERTDGLIATLDALAGLTRERTSDPLRLPLATGLDPVDQAQAWSSLLEEFGLVRAGAATSVFFPRSSASDEPAFVAFFRGPLRPPDAAWLASARDGRIDRPGDLAFAESRAASGSASARENVPSLAGSLRGVLATHRARSR